jgi:predicted GH43/DUF377 family glycosyl hydrolase
VKNPILLVFSRSLGFLSPRAGFVTGILSCFLPAMLQAQDSWIVGPFVKLDSANPCLIPSPASEFRCPVRGNEVHWEEKDVFNPAAVYRDGKVYLLYRAQDRIGAPAGTSRIGLAWSEDGIHFIKRPTPVLFPDRDFMQQYEWEGGCEDPRVVLGEKGQYVMTYTAYDGRLARLAVATSRDLIHWDKIGLAFGATYRDTWSKSGSIVSRWVDGTQEAVKIHGKYWMYWGESDIFLAVSEDLLHWTPLVDKRGRVRSVLSPRPHSFDSRLVESGPPAFLTDAGIVLLYNSSNARQGGDPGLPSGTYAAGQALFARDDPARLISRSRSYFMAPERSYEKTGQVDNVCFLEGLVQRRGQWLLYYGTADSKIAVAAWRPRPTGLSGDKRDVHPGK